MINIYNNIIKNNKNFSRNSIILIILIILIIFIKFILNKNNEKFTTIRINNICPNNESPDYYHFNQLYNKYRQYFDRNYLVQEGIRRNQIQESELNRLRMILRNGIRNNRLSLKQRLLLEQEINSNKWRNNIFQDIDRETNRFRSKGDIITDYNPNIIGCPRRWMECHKWKS